MYDQSVLRTRIIKLKKEAWELLTDKISEQICHVEQIITDK